MNKLVIMCSEKIDKVFNSQNGEGFEILWDKDIEVTWNYIKEDEKGLSTVIIYGFEMVSGTIDKLMDKRRKDSLYKCLKRLEVNVVNIEHYVVDQEEYESVKNKIEPDEE